MSKTVSARIDDNLHTLITDEANQDGKTVNEKLKQVLNNHFEKNEEEKTDILEVISKEENNISFLDESKKIIDEKIADLEKTFVKIVSNVITDHEKKFEHKIKCSHSW